MVLPLLAVGMLTMIGIVGLSIDIGHAFLSKTRLQGSLDSAALSGARTLLLSDDPAAAGADARDAFAAHLGGPAGADAEGLELQYSDTLVPFVAGGDEPRYVRATYEGFASGTFFSGVLPGVGSSAGVAGAAVAGPVPVGYAGAARTCDIAPLTMCGLAGDTDCADGTCFGYRVGGRTEYELRLAPEVEDVARASASLAPAAALPAPACGDGSPFDGCVPAPAATTAPGNVRLGDLGCTIGSCVREQLAGAFDACLVAGEGVGTQGAVTPEPVIGGLMARLGVADSALSPSAFPPDVVTTDRTADVDYWYDRYRGDVASHIAAGAGDGVPYRRVLAVPVASCGGAGGPDAGTLLGFLCLFLTRAVDASSLDGMLYGQFVDGCEASGEQGESVPALDEAYAGPLQVVLYGDPGEGGS